MAEVAIIYLPSTEDGGKQGVDDFLVAGHTVDDLLDRATTELKDPPQHEATLEEPATQAATLVHYAEESDLFHTPDDEPYVTFTVGDQDAS
jgi:hypothetical protein